MPIPKLEFDDPIQALPRQPVPLRLAYLASKVDFRTFRSLITRPKGDGNLYLTAYEYGSDRRVRTVDPSDYAETLPREAGDARLKVELISSLPKNHFVWSDEFVSEFKAALIDAYREPSAESLNELQLDWSPALHGMDDLLAECIDLSALTSDATANSEPSQREKGKQKTAARHKAWQDACLELEQKHPDKSLSWIAQRIARSRMGEGRSVETIRKNMKSRK